MRLTDGVLRTVTDTTLFLCFFTLASFGKSKTSIGAHRTFDEVQDVMSDFNYDTIKRALIQLHKKKLVTYQRGHLPETLAITREGKQRLQELFPAYKTHRAWDNRIYLVTYDIPQTQKKERELLRFFLKRLDSAMLQESVWIIPFDPRETLRSFIEDHNLSAVVIVSDMGKDAAIGNESLPSLICRIYKLDALNERYKEFLDMSQRKNFRNPFLITKYLSILRDDPQLPFALLPKGWLGGLAYHRYQTLCDNSLK